MTTPWKREQTRQNGGAEMGREVASDAGLSMIPWWSVVLAILAFAGAQYLIHFVRFIHVNALLRQNPTIFVEAAVVKRRQNQFRRFAVLPKSRERCRANWLEFKLCHQASSTTVPSL